MAAERGSRLQRLAAAAGAAAGALPAAASMSARTIRPPGPLPWMPDRSMFCACASLRASGEALTRSPSARGGAAAGCGGAGGVSTGACRRRQPSELRRPWARLRASAEPARRCRPWALRREASSPSPAMIAIGAPTFTPSVPSGTRILAILPSSTASNSIVALSVSISARMSPDFTSSPSLTSHLASVPSSIVGESAGILSSMGMRARPERLARLKANAASEVKGEPKP